jgi:hypothetical protein
VAGRLIAVVKHDLLKRRRPPEQDPPTALNARPFFGTPARFCLDHLMLHGQRNSHLPPNAHPAYPAGANQNPHS